MISNICAVHLGNAGLESFKDGICKTPGAKFHIHISDEVISVTVDLPKRVSGPETKHDAIKLEKELHDAVESVLAKLFE